MTLAAVPSSALTLAGLQSFAQTAPTEAEDFLRELSTNLKRVAATKAATDVDAMLGGSGALVDRMAAHWHELSLLFPAEANGWGALQQARASTIGYVTTDTQPPPPSYVSGTVSVEANVWKLTTPAGTVFTLADSAKEMEKNNLPRNLMEGLMHDGPMRLQGTLSADGKTFNVEAFALEKDPRYQTFTFGRILEASDPPLIDTPRGKVRIEDPTLLAKLKAMPRLGVILPGEPVIENGQAVYKGCPTTFFGLARFKDQAVKQGDSVCEVPYALGDMAWSTFNDKPCTIPAGSEARVNHTNRVWLEGDVVLSPSGEAVRFNSTYVGTACVGATLPKAAGTEADPVQTAVLMSAA